MNPLYQIYLAVGNFTYSFEQLLFLYNTSPQAREEIDRTIAQSGLTPPIQSGGTFPMPPGAGSGGGAPSGLFGGGTNPFPTPIPLYPTYPIAPINPNFPVGPQPPIPLPPGTYPGLPPGAPLPPGSGTSPGAPPPPIHPSQPGYIPDPSPPTLPIEQQGGAGGETSPSATPNGGGGYGGYGGGPLALAFGRWWGGY